MHTGIAFNDNLCHTGYGLSEIDDFMTVTEINSRRLAESLMKKSIGENRIRELEKRNAPGGMPNWLRQKPRTLIELRALRMDWYIWYAENTSDSGILGCMVYDMDSRVRCAAARNTKILEYELHLFACDQDKNVRLEITQNPNAGHRLLRKLSIDKSSDVRRGVALNVRTSVVILRSLACDKSPEVRSAVALNGRVPSKVIRLLINDSNNKVRLDAAKACMCLADSRSGYFQRLLSVDKYSEVRKIVGYFAVTRTVIKQLSTDRNSDVRKAVVLNSHVTPGTLKRLAKDANSIVREEAQKRLLKVTRATSRWNPRESSVPISA